MSTKVKSTFDLHSLYNRKVLTFISLLSMLVLVFSCLVSMFNGFSPFASGAHDKVVNNETELIDAISHAPSKTAFVIALGNDILLSSPIIISVNKDITLTSSKLVGFYKLIGASGSNTITVECGGVLKMDGIIVTHLTQGLYEGGGGVIVDVNGKFFMYSGEISDNSGVLFFSGSPVGGGGGFWNYGGGVLNHGVFEMYGGKISKNESPQGYGGGVFNNGSLTMTGGEI